MNRLSGLFHPARPKGTGSTSDKKRTAENNNVPASKKDNRSPTTERQRGLEPRKRKAHSRHRTECSELVPTIGVGPRAHVIESDAGSCCSDEDVWAYLNDSTASSVTVSATPDPLMGNDYVIRLSALLPGIDKPRFFKGRLDHGSLVSVISTKLVELFDLPVETVEPVSLRGFSRCSETTEKRAKLTFRIRPWLREFKVRCWIVEEQCMTNDLVLGRMFIEEKLHMRTNKLWRAITTAPPKRLKASEPPSLGEQSREVVLCSRPVDKPSRGQ